MFPSDEEEDAGGLSPAKDDDEVWREQTRKTLMNSIKEEYKLRLKPDKELRRADREDCRILVAAWYESITNRRCLKSAEKRS